MVLVGFTVIGYEHIKLIVKRTLIRLTPALPAGSIYVTKGSFKFVPKANTVISPNITKITLKVAIA